MEQIFCCHITPKSSHPELYYVAPFSGYMLATTSTMNKYKYKGLASICIAFSTLVCFQSVTSVATGADLEPIQNVNNSGLDKHEKSTTPLKIVDDASNRVDIIYSTDSFEAISPGVLHFTGDDLKNVHLSCQWTKVKTAYVRWNLHGFEARTVEFMKPRNDQNGIIINLASGPPVIRVECYLKDNRTISNNTLIYTGVKNPPYLYKHGELLRATVLNKTTASLPCLQKYPSDSQSDRKLYLFKDGKKFEENVTNWLSYSPELGYLLALPKLGNPLGTYECRIEKSLDDDYVRVLFDTGAFINVSYKHSDYIYAGSPQKRQFECQLPKNKFENQFIWYYHWKNGSHSNLDSDYLVAVNDPFYFTYYSQTVGVTFPSPNVTGIVCVGTAKDSESTYNNSYPVRVKESFPPKILNELSNEPIIYTPGRNLSCHTTTEPFHFEWLKNEKSADDEDVITEFLHPPFRTTLLLKKPTEDYTNYTCKLSNFHGAVEHPFRVRFLKNIGNLITVSYKGNSRDFYAGQGLQQTFECDLSKEIFEYGFEWFYHWKNGSFTPANLTSNGNDVEDDEDVSNSSYFETISTTFSSEDISGIACAGTVEGSNSQYKNSYPIKVKRAHKPHNLTAEPNQPIIYTNGLILTCYTTADPISSWSWYKNGELVKYENVTSGPSLSNQSTLYLGQLVDTRDSTFTCRASNFLGSASYHFTVPAAAGGNSLVVGIAVCIGVVAVLLLGIVLTLYCYTNRRTGLKNHGDGGELDISDYSRQAELGSSRLSRFEGTNNELEQQESDLSVEQEGVVAEIEANPQQQNDDVVEEEERRDGRNENDQNLQEPFEHAVKNIKIEAGKVTRGAFKI
ncbi:unnamed protein product [Orchesella dallaii]|uniref:Ig-like domain-containing protein n=1 Tax=Orchesella dallaii TaxID=48710 RepID=A0ABP1QBA2_9HEXA